MRKAYDLTDDDTAASYRQSSLPASYESVSGTISDAESALAVQPDLVEAYYNFGLILDELGRHEEAAKAMQKACQLAPKLFDKEIQTRRKYPTEDFTLFRRHLFRFVQFDEM